MKGLVKKAGLWLAVGVGLLAVALGLCTAHIAAGAELSFLQEDPELKATLLQWEQEAPQKVKAEIQILRTGDSLAKGRACDRLGEMGPEAKGAILALIETFTDKTQVKLREPDGRPVMTYPADEAVKALGDIGEAAVDPLMGALEDEDEYVRALAAWVLGEIADARAVTPLIGIGRSI